jgi:hypothetical protein
VIEKIHRSHTYVGPGGIGRVINFDASFMRVDTPDPATYLQAVQQLTPQ